MLDILGVPPLRGVGLSASSPAQGPHTKASPGFPLLSLTQGFGESTLPLRPCHAEVTKHLIRSIDTLPECSRDCTTLCVRDRSEKPAAEALCGWLCGEDLQRIARSAEGGHAQISLLSL